MCREFAPVVCSDGLQAFPICEELSDDSFRNWPGLPAVGQLLHHHEVCQALHEDKDGVAVSVHYEVHLKVAEALAVRLGRAVVYARAAGYVGGLDRFPARRRPALKVGMAAVPPQLTARVRVDDVVDALHGHLDAVLCQHSDYLLWRPQLVEHLLDAPYQHGVKRPVRRRAPAALKSLGVRLVPQVIAPVRGVAPCPPVDC